MKQIHKSRKREINNDVTQTKALSFSIPVSVWRVGLWRPRDKFGQENLNKAGTMKGNILYKRIKQKLKAYK